MPFEPMPGSSPRPLPVEDLNLILERTTDLWDDVRGARLLVTGGTGFVGRWLVESLCWISDRRRLNSRIVVLTRSPTRFAASASAIAARPDVELLAGDMAGFEAPRGQVDYVIHAATESVGPTGTFDPAAKFNSDVEGTRRVLELARGRGVRRLLYLSSGAVYGTQPRGLEQIPEDYVGAPDCTDSRTAYGQAKRASEFLCAVAATESALEAVIARGFAFAGPNLPLDSNYAFGNFIRDALMGGPIIVSGDGTPLRAYLYAADMAIWLWTLLLRGQSRRAYNVGSDAAISILSLAGTIASRMARPVEIVALGQGEGGPPQRYIPSIDRVRSEMGLVPLISLEDAIDRTLAWHLGSRGDSGGLA